jgi:hypothetical protein
VSTNWQRLAHFQNYSRARCIKRSSVHTNRCALNIHNTKKSLYTLYDFCDPRAQQQSELLIEFTFDGGSKWLIGYLSLTAQRKVNAPRRYWRGSHVRVLCNVEKCRGDAELRGSEWSPLVIGTWTASSHSKENTIHSRGSRGQCAHVPRNAELYQYSFFFSFNAVQNFCIVLFCIIPMRIKECREIMSLGARWMKIKQCPLSYRSVLWIGPPHIRWLMYVM